MEDRFKFRVFPTRLPNEDEKMEMIYDLTVGNNHLIHCDADKNIFIQGNTTAYNPESYHIMQCTGLKDCEGKLIYEGDIFTSSEYPFTDNGEPNYVGEVVWIDEFANFQYYLNCVNPKKRGISEGINNLLENILALDDIKIIGNIYENPELLEGKKDIKGVGVIRHFQT